MEPVAPIMMSEGGARKLEALLHGTRPVTSGGTVPGEAARRRSLLAAGNPAVATIVGAEDGCGWYRGKLLHGFIAAGQDVGATGGSTTLMPGAGAQAADADCEICNLAEDLVGVPHASHVLPAGLSVVGMLSGVAGTGKPVVVVCLLPAPVVVKITGNAAGGGKYTGRVMQGSMTAVAAGNAAVPEGLAGLGGGGGVGALVVNAAEDGEAGHAIGAGEYVVGVMLGVMTDGTWLVMIRDGGGGVTSGTAKYQVYQMTTDTTAGWDWVRAHA